MALSQGARSGVGTRVNVAYVLGSSLVRSRTYLEASLVLSRPCPVLTLRTKTDTRMAVRATLNTKQSDALSPQFMLTLLHYLPILLTTASLATYRYPACLRA
jgi:hypothetical protein